MSSDRKSLVGARTSAASEIEAAITGLRALDGSADEVERLAQRLAPQLAAPTAPAAPIVHRSGASATLKLLAGLIIGSVLLGGLLRYGAPSEEGQPVAIHALPAVRVSAVPVAPAEPSAAPAPVTPAAENAAAEALARPQQPAQRARPPVRVRSMEPQRPTRQPGSVEDELKLLSRAQTSLGTSPLGALSLCDEHAQHYARGVFTQEREVIAIEAEIKLGRGAAAASRARRFLQDFPRSTHAERVRALVADKKNAAGDNAGLEETPK